MPCTSVRFRRRNVFARIVGYHHITLRVIRACSPHSGSAQAKFSCRRSRSRLPCSPFAPPADVPVTSSSFDTRLSARRITSRFSHPRPTGFSSAGKTAAPVVQPERPQSFFQAFVASSSEGQGHSWMAYSAFSLRHPSAKISMGRILRCGPSPSPAVKHGLGRTASTERPRIARTPALYSLPVFCAFWFSLLD